MKSGKKLDKLPEKQKAKIRDYAKQKAEEAYKEVAEYSNGFVRHTLPITRAKQDLADYITKELVKKDLLIGAGLSTAGVIGLTTAGYQLGKKRKNSSNSNKKKTMWLTPHCFSSS